MDLTSWHVHGPVRTLRTEHAEWDPDRDAWRTPRHSSFVTFRRDGLVDDVTFHNPDGSVARQTRIYDAGGRILEERAWSGDEPRTRTTYSYDARGRLVGVDNVAPDGTRSSVTTSQYDRSGRLTKITHLPASDRDRPVCYSIEGTEYARGVPDAATLSVIADDRGLPVDARFHDANGGLLRRIVFSRDDHGRLLREVEQFAGDTPYSQLLRHGAATVDPHMAEAMTMAFEDQILSTVAYAYDDKGRLVERSMQLGHLSSERTTYEYDEHGQVKSETLLTSSRRIDVDDDGVVCTSEEPDVHQQSFYEYQYDARGNWTERIGLIGLGSGRQSQPSHIDRRTITYHEEG